MDKLAKAFGHIIGFILVACIIGIVVLALFNILFGLFSMATWLVTGEWFHVVSSTASSVF